MLKVSQALPLHPCFSLEHWGGGEGLGTGYLCLDLVSFPALFREPGNEDHFFLDVQLLTQYVMLYPYLEVLKCCILTVVAR